MLTLNDGRSELWQWDTGRSLTVPDVVTQVHFERNTYSRSIDVDVIDGIVSIPDILLQTYKDLTAWAFVGTPENGYTKISKVFKVNKRNKPSDYVFTPADQTTLKDILDRIEDLEKRPSGGNGGITKEVDPTVPDWAKQSEKPKYTASEVGALSQGELQAGIDLALEQARNSGVFDGDPGKSAYQYALDGGYTGTEEEFAQKLAADFPTSGGNIRELIADITADGSTAKWEFTGLDYKSIRVDGYFNGTYSVSFFYTHFHVNGVQCRVQRLFRNDKSPSYRYVVEACNGHLEESCCYGSMSGMTSVESFRTIMDIDKIDTFVINGIYDRGTKLVVTGVKR